MKINRKEYPVVTLEEVGSGATVELERLGGQLFIVTDRYRPYEGFRDVVNLKDGSIIAVDKGKMVHVVEAEVTEK